MTEKDFNKFALSRGINSLLLNDYKKHMDNYIEPYVIEERNLNISTLSVYSRLMMDRIIFLGSEINDDVANIISAQLLWLEQQSDKDITIHVNSGGGNIYSGYVVLDSMNFIKPDISTVSMGMVASMATIIASSGTKGKRFILPHTRFLIHQPLSGGGGMKQCSDIQIHANEIQTLKVELTQILANNSGQSYETIEKMCDRDTIFTAQKAVELGFVDKVIESKKQIINVGRN